MSLSDYRSIPFLQRDHNLVRIRTPDLKWPLKDATLTPYLIDKFNTFALCDVVGDYSPPYSPVEKGSIRYSIEILQQALEVADRLGLSSVAVEILEGRPLLALVGRLHPIAITIAPRIEGDV